MFGAAPLSLPTGAHCILEDRTRSRGSRSGRSLNSLKLALLNTAGQLVTCSMAAYAFAAIPFRGRGPLFGLLLAMIIPAQVVLVPNFILWRSLPNPFEAAASTAPRSRCGSGPGWAAFGTFLLRQLLAVPVELADAADRWRQPGRSSAGSTCRSPGRLATLAIFTFMWTWNDLLNPLIYLQHLDQYTTTVGLAFFQGQYYGKWPEMMAGALVSLAPMILLFILAQQYFVRGIALSGLKG